MNQNLFNEFTNAFSKKPKFFVKGQDGGLKEIKEYSVADVGVQGTFYVHKQIIGSDYALSERKTGLRISTGATKEIAIGKGKAIIADYIDKNGIDAFYDLIKGQQINEDVPEVPKPIEIDTFKEVEVITPPQEETINTTLISSLNYMNCIDVDYIADLLKISVDEVRELLLIQELAFVNPENEKLETKEEYLSGNVREKLRLAEEAFKTNHRYERNVNSLKEVIPETIPAGLIQYSLGAAWIPLPIFEQFALGMFKSKIMISYMASTGKLSVQNKGMPTVQIKSTYAAGGKNGVEILNATMNNQQIIIHESIGGKQVKNIEMTSSAQQMQEQMQEEFIAFVRADKNIEAETEEIYNEIFNSYRERDFWTPELKHYPNANPAITPMDHQKRGVARAMSESTLFAHEVGLGKAQPLDAKILTPNGWSTMGELKVGDLVISVDGKPTKVTHLHPQGEKEIFKVIFSDGSSTECCNEHLWLTMTYQERTNANQMRGRDKDWECAKPKVRTLSDIRKTLVGRKVGGIYAKNHSIPIVEPIQFESFKNYLDPYLVGVIIGDGSIREGGISITSIDTELIDKVKTRIPKGYGLKPVKDKKGGMTFHIGKDSKKMAKKSQMINELKRMELWGKYSYEKHIPKQYIFNSIQCRLQMLRGLMDTDGFVDNKSGTCIFYTTSQQLSKDFTLLVQTLGGTTSIKHKIPKFTHKGEKKIGRICYVISIKLPNCFNPFSLTRKAERVKFKTKYPSVRYIVDIVDVGIKQAQCITVSHSSHLYVTDDCIVTHNSILIMITALELRRLGLAKKPMIAVQNKTIGQFITKFRELYPNANLLYPSESDLTAFGKPYFYERIRDEDFDAVIFPQSQFDAIPDDIDRQLEILDAQMEAAEYVLMNTSKASMPFQYSQTKREIRALQRDIDKLTEEKKLLIQQHQELSQTEGYKPLLTFEQMGVDALLLDEFHRWKRLGFSTSLFNIKGIDTAKSARSQSCLLKMRWVQQNNGGRNTFGYTGTPISNTMAEAWTMIRYFRPDILVDLGIQHFDQFAKTFGQIVPSLEQTGGGTFKIQNRFAKFQNLPEFVAAFRKCTDVVFSEDVPEFTANNILPKLIDDRIDQVIVKRSQELVDQIAKFKETLEWYEALEGMMRRQYSYIPLVIFNRAKQASIDLRLLNPTNRDNPLSKVNQVIRKAFRIYEETQLVQMIFCDLYQSPEPKSEWMDEDCTIPNTAYGMPRFNLFNDIKEKLISMGVKPSEIVIMNEAKYDKKERAEKVFEDANAGRIKFLLGSTEKMGVGVNVQKKLYWLHHVDAPARPMDFGQRNGRIIRPFNLNPFVGISAYGTERTLDSAAFQRLAIKQAFINQILKGENLERVTEDAADEALMTFNEMMAHLSDSPYAQQKLLIDNRLKSERLKRDNFYAKQQQINRSLVRGQEELERLRLDYEHQTKYYAETFKFFPEATITELKIGENVYLEGKGTALNEYMDFLIDRMRSSPTKVAMGMFFVNGAKVSVKMEVQIQWSQITKEHYDAPSLSYTIPEIGIFPNAYDNGVSVDSCSGSGMLTSIRWKIDSIISRPKETEKKIKQYEVTIEELERTLNTVYDLTRLEELEAEVEVIKDKMMNEVIVEEELI